MRGSCTCTKTHEFCPEEVSLLFINAYLGSVGMDSTYGISILQRMLINYVTSRDVIQQQ